MANLLTVFWHLVAHPDHDRLGRRLRVDVPDPVATRASATIFLVLRRMRAPLVVLIVIFAVSMLGLTLVPGQDEAGRPARLSFFQAFYFMSSTATTIGFGEIPGPFTPQQRMWVTFCIYLTVIGWAYAIGSLLALLQDGSFRNALELRRFTRKVARLREPFLLLAGYGQTGRLLGQALDDRGRRFVVLDRDELTVEELELGTYYADVPALVGDAGDPGLLATAGLASPYCEGVVAITNDDQVNLAVCLATALLRPDVGVIARTSSRTVGHRMAEVGHPVVINPFDRFGDRLRVALRAPSVYRLLTWLTSTTGGGPPELTASPPAGRWVVCGTGRFGQEISDDLRGEGFDVDVVEPLVDRGDAVTDVLPGTDLATAAGLVAATDSDTVNLSVIAGARRLNPQLFVVARENQPASSPLYQAMDLDAHLIAPDMVAREALARLGDPMLWDFLAELPGRSERWGAELVERLRGVCGDRTPHLWDVHVTVDDAPALVQRGSPVSLGALLRDPVDRDTRLAAVPLLLVRDGRRRLCPGDDVELVAGDALLLAGTARAHHVLDTTLLSDAALEYAVSGRRIGSGWVWRRLVARAFSS